MILNKLGGVFNVNYINKQISRLKRIEAMLKSISLSNPFQP